MKHQVMGKVEFYRSQELEKWFAVRKSLTADLGLNDGQSSEGTSAVVLVHLGSPLEQTGVEVEHVSRVGLATWRSSQQQRHLTVGHSLCVCEYA